MASRRCVEAEAEGGYIDFDLVRACRDLSLDLRGLRRTVLGLGVSLQHLEAIKHHGLAAIPDIDRACWNAFRAMDVAAGDVNLALGGCFLGIGWFEPDNEAEAKLSARWMGGGKHASAFVRVIPGHSYKLSVTAHHLHSADMASWLHLTVCGEQVQIERSLSEDGTAVLTAEVPKEVVSCHEGRLRIGVVYNDLYGVDGWVSVSRIEAVTL